MTRKVFYEFKMDKRGRKYANRVDSWTGKKTRIAYKLAQKRDRDIRYRERKKEVLKAGIDWNEYQREKKILKKEKQFVGENLHKEIIRRIKGIPEREPFEVRTRLRMRWKWWTKPFCNTPQYESWAEASDGDHYDEFVDMAEDAYNDIMASDLCPGIAVEGGSCVVLYEKPKKKHQKIYNILKMHELGDGCIRGVERGM
ncbi:MAG: hypothetical protein ACKVE3_06990 [Dissulfuribacterales bacterium]